MTKEELDRIKKAYSSGLKVQIWFNGHWEDFDIRDYSMYPEPFSENRQYRIVGSAYADIAEKRIAELKKENAELKKACDETQELLDKQIETTYKVVEENNELKEKLNKATEILKVVLNKWKEERWILQSEKEVKMIRNSMKEAEQFLKE